MGSNQYHLLPFRVKKVNISEYLNAFNRQYFMLSFKPPASDASYTEDPNGGVCEIFR